jgi:hypothetical protein
MLIRLVSPLALVLVALALVVTLAPTSTAHAQANGTVTGQCTMMRAMQWLSIASGVGSGAQYDTLSMRERVACGAGIEAADPEYWPNGGTLRSGDTWYYPNGGTAITSSGTYYPNGGTASSGDTWYYPNGGTMISGAQYYLPNGGSSSESGLLEHAMSRLSRARCDELLGLRMQTSDPFWRSMYFAVLMGEASRA